jgi:predicted O-linked N-acetylglucosamine transferase (SPINDLY family)
MIVTPHLAAIRDEARRLHEAGRLAESLQVHEEALRLAPEAVGIWLSAGRLAHEMGLPDVSLAHFEQALELDPNCHAALEFARRICVAAGLIERAVQYSQRAYGLRPTPEILIARKLLVPAIATSRSSVAAARARYEEGVDEILASPLTLEQPDGVLGTGAFFLAYHGRHDRALQEKTARMFLKLMPGLSMTAKHCGRARRPGKIRVGFISRFFYAHSIFSTSVGLIERLSRDRFQVFALRITPSLDDAATAKIRAAADRCVDLSPDLREAREQIAALELDVLFYQDIGMEPIGYFLAFARLAPVQCVSFGHPNTTGIPTLDYFVSNDAFEPEGAAEHYSEKLYLLRDLPTLAYYYKPIPPPPLSREALGLPTDRHVYLCPQTLYKVHPDFDDLVRGILERDPDGIVVFIAGQFSEFTDQLRRRLAWSTGFESRVLFLPRMDSRRFLQLLSAADVILDTVHFNGMNSSLEALAVGTPVVTLPGGLQRGRHTLGMYRRMQLFDAVAQDDGDYIDIAVRLGTDPAQAQRLRREILARNHTLFEEPRVVQEFERFFSDAVRARPPA